MIERDLVGYGMNLPDVRWPGDARIAISVVVNYEEGSEDSLLDGDSHRETNGEINSPLPLDARDLMNECRPDAGLGTSYFNLQFRNLPELTLVVDDDRRS